MKKHKLLTLGIGSLVIGSSSVAFIASCGENIDSEPNTKDGDNIIPPGPDNEGFPGIPLIPSDKVVPKIPLNPSIKIPQSTEDVTSHFKSGLWPQPGDPSYIRRYVKWNDSSTDIPPVGDYLLHFETEDLNSNHLEFTFSLHIDNATGGAAQSARIAANDGQTNLKIVYSGIDTTYPERSGQIYLEYFTPHSGEWWPYGQHLNLTSAKRINYDSPKVKLVDSLNLVDKNQTTGYSMKGARRFKPNSLYIAEVKVELLGRFLTEATIKVAFMTGDPNTNRIYSHVGIVETTFGIVSVTFTPDGFLLKYRDAMTISSTGTINSYQMLSLNEVQFS